MFKRVLGLFLLASIGLVASKSISDFGAVAGLDTFEQAQQNALSILKAFDAANAEGETDRTVHVPKLAGNAAFYVTPFNAEGMTDVTFQVDGILRVNNDLEQWDKEDKPAGIVMFTEANGLHLTGSGTIDGQGTVWWEYVMQGKGDFRSNLVDFESSQHVEVSHIYLLNSPRFNLNLHDVAHASIHDITIFTDSNVTRPHGRHGAVYPLNTDGIDLAATDVAVYNNVITNYDDAIVAKPCNGGGKYCQCSGNMDIYNNKIMFSVGLTIGSVPPNDEVNCVRNVTFRDSSMWRPLKALYIKSNPGTSGSAIIQDITYKNLYLEQTVWWTIWLGPQQQNQPGPDDTNTGCNFLFPFIPVCPTNPLVTIKDILFENITAVDTLPLFEGPGVFLCDEANPCTGVAMVDVKNTMFTGDFDDIKDQIPIPAPGVVWPSRIRSDDFQWEYLVDNVYGGDDMGDDPAPCFNDPECFWDGTSRH